MSWDVNMSCTRLCTITLSLLWLGMAFISPVCAQEEFQGPITCYFCYDRAINTTCGDPMWPDDTKLLDTIVCKRGACVKWTFYRFGVLMMQRTCSEKVNMHIPLNTVCRTERNGNGYLCMCAKDHCNSARRVGPTGGVCLPLLLTLLPALSFTLRGLLTAS